MRSPRGSRTISRASISTGRARGLAWVDLSTGRLRTLETSTSGVGETIERLAPAELLVSSAGLEPRPELSATLRDALGPRITERDPWCFERESSLRLLLRHLKVASLEGFGIVESSPVVGAAGALLAYVEETQRSACEHIHRIEVVDPRAHVVLDRATRSCLEIFRTQREGRREGTLIDVLDGTSTPMGGRMLLEWLEAPLRDVDAILARQRAVAELVEQPFLREETREILSGIRDLERATAKVSTGRANARDLVAIATSLGLVKPLREKLAGAYSARLAELREALDPLDALVARVGGTLVDAPPLTLKEGGLVRAGHSADLDELRSIAGDGKSWMARMQAEESARTGIPGLKVGFNSVFGYFIEVPRGQASRVPEAYIRRQTVKNAERYVTPELKEFESKVLGAEERSRALEYRIFEEIRAAVAAEIPRILSTARAVAQIDVLAGLAQKAAENRYVAPEIDDGETIRIVDGRHPAVERALGGEPFVPNDTRMNRSDRMLSILTGPNMAGKSTWIRQSATIVLMAQVGSFVPASEAKVGVVDRVFTRIGSADDIGRSASTFMVEMLEIANILNNAGPSR
jgi:DNA mismatch repair protein MutS